MPKATYARCRICNRHRDEVGLLSRTRLCGDCGETRDRENAMGIHLHRGPWFQHWREATAATVGAVLLDSLTAAELRALADVLDELERAR